MSHQLSLLRHKRAIHVYTLDDGTHTIGRHQDCGIVVADSSVSRQHAELTVEGDSVHVRDLDSRNGIKINGVPRKTARLQEGDRLHVGNAELGFSTRPQPAARTGLGLALENEVRQNQTQKSALRLPDARPERHLAAFYHLTSWVTDGVEEAEGLPHWLELLGESLRAHTVHFYDPKGKLSKVHTPEGPKPRIKFAPYLLERFVALHEATAYAPRELDRYQQRLGQYHYLVAPLKLVGTGPEISSCPVVAIMRPSDWEPFSVDDRVLLQSAVQLWLKSVNRAAEVHHLRDENKKLKQKSGQASGDGLIGSGPAVANLRQRLARTAATTATVLITGETGSGKEVTASALHAHSPRVDKPFIKVNCGAIPDGLIESELFGHVKGAFTDARSDRTGKFSAANGGTLFLDEIGELPLTAQTKLLRVLEEGLVEPLGSEKPRKIDVRVVAATNRDLADEVAAKRFREDLYYRLNVVTVKVPALREHPEDLPELAQHFLNTFCAENGLAELSFDSAALKALQEHDWPGNVRELRNVVQRLAIEADGAQITQADVTANL